MQLESTCTYGNSGESLTVTADGIAQGLNDIFGCAGAGECHADITTGD